MGIASRKKWEHRAATPTVKRKGVTRARQVDPAKLAHRIDVTNRANVAKREGIFGPRRTLAKLRAAVAVAKHQGHIARRRKAARSNGWRPHAQR